MSFAKVFPVHLFYRHDQSDSTAESVVEFDWSSTIFQKNVTQLTYALCLALSYNKSWKLNIAKHGWSTWVPTRLAHEVFKLFISADIAGADRHSEKSKDTVKNSFSYFHEEKLI